MSFLNNNYERSEATSQYLKFEPNETATIRVVGVPVEGYQVFKDGKPLRWSYDSGMPEEAYGTDDKVRPFAAFTVWHYEAKMFKLYVCATKSVLQELVNLSDIEGSPADYDLKITRKGAGLDTKYYVKVGDKGAFDEQLLETAKKFNDATDIDELFVQGGNPFK
jgi:hypothetical protein